MELFTEISKIKKKITEYKKQNLTIGLVPTMGALHRGHLSLIEESKRQCDITVVSVFVNPIQFGPNEDFNKYPRPIQNDIDLCKENMVDIVFNPSVEEIIGRELLTFVDIKQLGDNLCGSKREGHFRGVCTIVSKLFNIVKPDKAFFGKKDIQQLYIIKKMTDDLNFDTEIIPCNIVREPDGLAMSSRNQYLLVSERSDALMINKLIKESVSLIDNGENSAKNIIHYFEENVNKIKSAKIDYISIVDSQLKDTDSIVSGNILAVAIFIGKTRLIDNHIIGEKICW